MSSTLRAPGRRATAVELDALLTEAEASFGPPSPAERLRHGLGQVRRALVEGRRELEQLESDAQRARQDLVDGEAASRAIALQAMRARMPRHLQPGERCGPERQLQDGRTLTAAPELDAITLRSLTVMGLRPTGERRPTSLLLRPREDP